MRRIAVTLFLAVLSACGADYASGLAPRGTGRGTLISSAVLKGAVGQLVVVPFDVQLPCGPGGPLRDISAASGQILDPADHQSHLSPTWQTADRLTYDCTETEWQRVTHLEVAFTPTAAGTYRTDLTLEPSVGTFSRAVEAQ